MTIDHVLDSVAVKDLDQAAAWFATLPGDLRHLRQAGNRPLPEVAAW